MITTIRHHAHDLALALAALAFFTALAGVAFGGAYAFAYEVERQSGGTRTCDLTWNPTVVACAPTASVAS